MTYGIWQMATDHNLVGAVRCNGFSQTSLAKKTFLISNPLFVRNVSLHIYTDIWMKQFPIYAHKKYTIFPLNAVSKVPKSVL